MCIKGRLQLKLSSNQHKLCQYYYSASPTTHILEGYSKRTTIFNFTDECSFSKVTKNRISLPNHIIMLTVNKDR